MNSVLDHAARRIRRIERYRPGRESGERLGKLSSNELYLGASPRVRTAIVASADDAHRYPSADVLIAAIAAFAHVDPSRVIPTSGSDELCFLLGALLLAEGDSVVLGHPCYRLDEIVTHIGQAELRPVPLIDGAHDLERMAQASADARLVWLPSPHNPSGVAVNLPALDHFLDEVPDTCLVVLDEAYRDFADAARRPQVNRLLARHPNLLVQRTLSKAFGLAGLRIGYGLGHPDLIGALNSIKSPFNVNSTAAAAAPVALADDAWYRLALRTAREERARLEAFLTAHGFSYWPSQANFVTVHLGPRTNGVVDRLTAAGVQVRDGADLGLPGSIRISLGAPPTMAVVRSVLLQEAPSRFDRVFE